MTGPRAGAEGKRRFRAEALAIRDGLSPEERREAALAAARAVLASSLLEHAAVVMAYAAVRSELDPGPLVEALWERGKSVAFPVADPATRGLTPRAVSGFEEMTPGLYGIPAPPASAPEVPVDAIDAVLVPGVAFDREGYRIGYGGGYYDRFLARLGSGCVRIGYAYARLVLERVPREAHDLAVDWIATEEGVRACSGEPGR